MEKHTPALVGRMQHVQASGESLYSCTCPTNFPRGPTIACRGEKESTYRNCRKISAEQLANQNRASPRDGLPLFWPLCDRPAMWYDAPCHGPLLLSGTSPTGDISTPLLCSSVSYQCALGKVPEGTPPTT